MSADLSFSSLLGQEQAKRMLERPLSSGRLAHAYLFRGPDGVGKKLAASLTAARLNCAGPDRGGACGACASCRKWLSGNHPDIVVVSPENGSIKIDRIRELCRSLSYPPYESGLRVVIIEDVQAMTQEAANSLLKTLEEPPEQNLLILTAEPSRELLPTIISRCQVIAFHGLEGPVCARVIRQKQPDIDEEEARLLADLAAGSPGTALVLREKKLVPVYRSVLQLLETEVPAARGDISPILETAAELAALKEDLPLFLGLLRIWARDLMLQDGGAVNLKRQNLRLAALDQAHRQLERNCNRTLVCEVLLFNLQSPMPAVS